MKKISALLLAAALSLSLAACGGNSQGSGEQAQGGADDTYSVR